MKFCTKKKKKDFLIDFVRIIFPDMTKIDEQFIQQCSLTIGQFDSDIVNQLVPLYRDQRACVPFDHFPNEIREQFENLLSCQDINPDVDYDTPLTRIELAVMMHFKQTYLTRISPTFDPKQLKMSLRFDFNDEISSAYCLLIAQIGDRMSRETHLPTLKFQMGLRGECRSLFELYVKSGQTFLKFVSNMIESRFFDTYLVRESRTLRDFQLFILRYEDFLKNFSRVCQSLPQDQQDEVEIEIDVIPDTNESVQLTSGVIQMVSQVREELRRHKGHPVSPTNSEDNVPHFLPKSNRSPAVSPPFHSSRNSLKIPRRGLCVVINVQEFAATERIEAGKREGSEKDVELVRIIFEKMQFTVLTCVKSFTKKEFEEALAHINDVKQYGSHDCLVLFIMSHGLLQTILTADGQEIVIRDIIKSFSDSSPQTIWAGKPRLIFLQACRTERPQEFSPIVGQEVKKSDLSPNMLVAFSCSPNQSSIRYKSFGTAFVQILCMTIFDCGHEWQIQSILDLTRRTVIKLHEIIGKNKKEPARNQIPEYIEGDFDSNFRLTSQWMRHKYALFPFKAQLTVDMAFDLWVHPIYKLAAEDPRLHPLVSRIKSIVQISNRTTSPENRLVQPITA